MKKRLFQVILASVMCVLFIAGCASPAQTPAATAEPAPAATAAPEATEAPAPQLKADLNIWVYDEFYTDAENSPIEQLTKGFTDANPGVTVTFTPVPYGSSSYRDKFIQAAQGGSGPDVILSDNVWVPQLAAMDLIVPLTQQLGDKKDEFFPGTIDAATWNNEIYGVPFHTDVMVLFYNKDMFKAAGLDPEAPPTTWDEFRNDAIAVTKAGNAGFGLMGGWGGSFEWLPWLWQNGGDVLDSEGKIRFNDAAGHESVEFFLNLLTVDKVIPEASLTWKSWDELAAGFANQSYAMCEGMDVMLQKLNASKDISFEWGVAELPSKAEKASMLGGGHWVINKNSEQQDAAYAWIDFISGKNSLPMMDSYMRTSARKDAGEQEIIKNDARKQVFVKSLEYARPRPIIAEWTTIDYDCIQPAFMQVIFEGRDISSAMDEAVTKAEAALAE